MGFEACVADRVRAAAAGDQLGAWGLRDNTKDLPGSGVEPIIWDRISTGTVALFSNRDEYFCRATVIGKGVSEAASRELWGSPDFRWLVWLSEIRDTAIPLEVVLAGGGIQPSYKLNRQALVPRANREAGPFPSRFRFPTVEE